jgi:hypothetical protein
MSEALVVEVDQDRAEKMKKPAKLFSINVDFFSDGIACPFFLEHTTMSRKKIKLIHQSAKSFLNMVKGLIPATHDRIKNLVETLEPDMSADPNKDEVKIGIMNVEIYSDNYVELECYEVVRGVSRGAPRKVYLEKFEFIQSMKAQHITGDTCNVLKLLNGGSTTEED